MKYAPELLVEAYKLMKHKGLNHKVVARQLGFDDPKKLSTAVHNSIYRGSMARYLKGDFRRSHELGGEAVTKIDRATAALVYELRQEGFKWKHIAEAISVNTEHLIRTMNALIRNGYAR